MLDVEIAGERVVLLPERALLWPARATLVIADPHFGKDDVFRRSGVALPAGDLDRDLHRLGALVDAHAVCRVVVLGDLMHAVPAAGDALVPALLQFLRARPTLAFEAVVGNHDRRSGRTSLAEAVHWRAEPACDGPFAFAHLPSVLSEAYVLAGHVHPCAVLGHGGPDRVRVPAFCIGRTRALLPAFGSFTGGANVRLEPGDTLFAVGGSRVWRLPRRLRG